MTVVFGVATSSLFVLKTEKSSALFAPVKKDLIWLEKRRRNVLFEDLRQNFLVE
jgi:hypothetical protein